MLEEKIAEQFVRGLLMPIVDQYGFSQDSPVKQALTQFIKENKDKLLAEVLKVLTVESVGKIIADQLKDSIKGIYGSGYDREKIFTDLKSKIGEHLAKKISEDLKI